MKIKALKKVPNHIVLGFGFCLTGIPGAVQILNSIEGSLEDVLTSVVSSDNNTIVPADSTNSNMVVIEITSLALPA
jgi:hypothetical protein